MRHEFVPSEESPDVCVFNCGYEAEDHKDISGIYAEDEIVSSDYFDVNQYVHRYSDGW